MGWFGNKDEDINEDVSEEDDSDEEESEDEEESDEETYEMNYDCDNCTNEESYEIPFGIKIEDFLKGKKCEFCGCLVIESQKEK